MSTTREFSYKGKKVKITVAYNAGTYVGSYGVEGTDPYMRGVGADSNSEEGALSNAEDSAREAVDRLG